MGLLILLLGTFKVHLAAHHHHQCQTMFIVLCAEINTVNQYGLKVYV